MTRSRRTRPRCRRDLWTEFRESLSFKDLTRADEPRRILPISPIRSSGSRNRIARKRRNAMLPGDADVSSSSSSFINVYRDDALGNDLAGILTKRPSE